MPTTTIGRVVIDPSRPDSFMIVAVTGERLGDFRTGASMTAIRRALDTHGIDVADDGTATRPDPTAPRVCPRCKGTTITVRDAFTYHDRDTGRETHYQRTESKCYACDGVGSFPPPDTAKILADVRGRKGLCSKRPAARRSYYVWRMARFHGGADVTMPMGASMDCASDPWLRELDMLADAVAKRAFGTDLAAAHRWGTAMGWLQQGMPGLPASAYPCGPVADADKPIEESAELY